VKSWARVRRAGRMRPHDGLTLASRPLPEGGCRSSETGRPRYITRSTDEGTTERLPESLPTRSKGETPARPSWTRLSARGAAPWRGFKTAATLG
jgi:hypothetical protein